MTIAEDPNSHMTPYDDAYRTCERTYAELRIYCGELDPRWITQRLGIEPTSSQTIGQGRSTTSDAARYAKTSAWFLSSEGAIASKDLRRHLDWLLERLSGAGRGLKELQDEPGIRMTVNCVWWSAAGHGGPTLWPTQMRRLSELDLECSFDVGFYGDENC